MAQAKAHAHAVKVVTPQEFRARAEALRRRPAAGHPTRALSGARQLAARAIEHRRRMLRHLGGGLVSDARRPD